MQIFSTIFPVFAVVILGWLARRRGGMPQEFLDHGNRLVYHVAIPALIFSSVAKADFGTRFNGVVLGVTLLSAALVYLTSWFVARAMRLESGRTGSFVQCSAHGNIGYIGLPISYYFLGDTGVSIAAIIGGFLMILQNVFSVFALQAYSEVVKNHGGRWLGVLEKLVKNPVIVSAMLGVLVSLADLNLPLILQRFLDILSGLAPPMSLLLIGASLSLQVIRGVSVSVGVAVGLKLIVLPAVGMFIFRYLGVPVEQYLPSLILLATPSATVAYVMSKEMDGDPGFAGAVISLSTLASLVTYIIWLSVFGKALQ